MRSAALGSAAPTECPRLCTVCAWLAAAGGFRGEADEEFEDAEGNVYSKKTYEDLKRQGLI